MKKKHYHNELSIFASTDSINYFSCEVVFSGDKNAPKS